LSAFDLSPVYSDDDEFRHWFLPRPDIIDSYVVENEQGTITGQLTNCLTLID
jgi:glycylpeptide N-tetradecanoyltransferase